MNLYNPIIAMFVIMGAAFVLNIISNILTKYMVYTPEFVERRRTINQVRKEYMELRKTGDEKQLKKLEKKLESMRKMETELSIKSFKPMIFTFILFYLMWWWLSGLYKGMDSFVLLPFPLPYVGSSLNLFWWYLVASFWLGAVMRKLFIPEI